MKFSIITPTYKRRDRLTLAMESVLHQTYTDWEMIVVNDSPDDLSYVSFEKNVPDNRIKYFKNEDNSGVNFSRNFALGKISPNSDYVIFLDDDDWFEEDALENFTNLISANPNEGWFVTNRALKSSAPLTFAPENNRHYSYAWDYLILKKIKGDATHCIKKDLIKNIQFTKSIKQGEEWFFFYQLGLKNKLFYNNHGSTVTEGYNRVHGLNFRSRTRTEQLITLARLISEGSELHLLYHPTFVMYLIMRLVRLVFRP